MAKNIEMNHLSSDGSYETLYPKTIAQIVSVSDALKQKLNKDNVDDILADLDTRLQLSQYNCAAIQVTLKSTNGNPLENIKINGISKNLDMTGECYTDSNGYVQGYAQVGSVTLSSEDYADLSIASVGPFTVVAGCIYSKELIGTVVNFKKYISSASIKFSSNMNRLDVTAVGGGGGASSNGDMHWGSAGGGGGGYVTVQENVSFSANNTVKIVVGAGGSYNQQGGTGGTTSFLGVSASGGAGGTRTSGGKGNGDGAAPALKKTALGSAGITWGLSGTAGTQYGYSSFTQTTLYGGGGGSGGLMYGYSSGSVSGGSGGSPGGGKGGTVDCSNGTGTYGDNGVAGTGGGGGSRAEGYNGSGLSYNSSSGSGGCGCVAIRMHPKVY